MTSTTTPAVDEIGSTGGCPIDHTAHHGYEPFDMHDPFEAYSRLRDEAPVMYDERIGYWVVTRYDDVKAAFDDWETFSSENAQAPVTPRSAEASRIMTEGGFTAYSGLSARIPPEHTRLRAIAQKAFTPRRYKVLEPAIRANVVAQLEAMLAHPDKTGDFLRDIAFDIPTITILTLLGVDPAMVPTYKKWSESRAAMTWGKLSDEEQIPHAHRLVDYWTECQRLVTAAHAEGGDNLIADLVGAQDGGAEISDHEIASLCYSLLFAGHETTTTLISNTIRVLLGQRASDQGDPWQRIVDDPSLIPGAIDEILRFSGSIVAWRRKALKDTEIGGVPIRAGDGVLLVMGSANRDPEVFENPDQFDIARANARTHLSFGYGIHYCLGNMLAKLQDRIVLEETARLVPSLRLRDEHIGFLENLSFRVPTSVPVTWE